MYKPEVYGWDLNGISSKYQCIISTDSQLSRKLGIAPQSKILVFAGCFGDWAGALAEVHEVHYTDVS